MTSPPKPARPKITVRDALLWSRWLVVVPIAYLTLAHCAYAFRHPELTDTERFLQTWEALTWK